MKVMNYLCTDQKNISVGMEICIFQKGEFSLWNLQLTNLLVNIFGNFYSVLQLLSFYSALQLKVKGSK